MGSSIDLVKLRRQLDIAKNTTNEREARDLLMSFAYTVIPALLDERERLRADCNHMHDEMDAARDGETAAIQDADRLRAQLDGVMAGQETLQRAWAEDIKELEQLRAKLKVANKRTEYASSVSGQGFNW